MMVTSDNDERESVYKEYRAAKRNLKKGRDFTDWMKIARGYDQARREAMNRAGTNKPQGAAYRAEFSKIDRREKLIDRDDKGREFPSPEERTYCIKVLENYDMPSYDPRRIPIKAYRDGLSDSERANLNHPKRVWTSYWADTDPEEDKQARRIERAIAAQKKEPLVKMADLLAETQDAHHTSQQEAAALRRLLGRILAELGEVLSPELREAITDALAK